jgi:hypothetical protein
MDEDMDFDTGVVIPQQSYNGQQHNTEPTSDVDVGRKML